MDDTIKIVLLGKTGVGKSSLANTIFGKNVFKVGHGFNSQTSKCQAETKSETEFQTSNEFSSETIKCPAATASVKGRRITIIDIPGFFDTHASEEELKAEIASCITECSPGPHAFLIVLKVERFTELEQAVVSTIKQHFSDEVLEYSTVVFTHGDQLPKGNIKIMDWVKQSPPVSDLVDKCGGRCHVIDNIHWKKKKNRKQGSKQYRSNQFQVGEIFKSIDEIIEAKQGACYTNEFLKIVEENIQQITLEQSSENLSREEIREIREQAKNSVYQRILIKATSIGTGALLGALLSVTTICMLSKSVQEITAGTVAGIESSFFQQLFTGLLTITGGTVGGTSTDGAETLQQAAKNAAEAVKNVAMSVIDIGHAVKDRLFRREPRANT